MLAPLKAHYLLVQGMVPPLVERAHPYQLTIKTHTPTRPQANMILEIPQLRLPSQVTRLVRLRVKANQAA